MQRDHGAHFWLKVPFLYNLFQGAIGGNALRRTFIERQVRAKPGDKVIDIGCGPAKILQWLPEVDYLGFDVNPAYIATAERKYTGKGTFVVGDTNALSHDPRFKDADVVIGLGILHHLDDHEAEHCIRFAHRALKPGGRLLCCDACWIPNQRFLSRYVMSRDRGQNIRTEQMYRQLVGSVFKNVETRVDTKPLRIPYVMIFLECHK